MFALTQRCSHRRAVHNDLDFPHASSSVNSVVAIFPLLMSLLQLRTVSITTLVVDMVLPVTVADVAVNLGTSYHFVS